MAWGMGFKTEVNISREHYSSIEDVKDRLLDIEEDLSEVKNRLMILAASTPKDIINEEDIITAIHNEVKELLEEVRELSEKRLKLRLLIEYLEDGGDLKKTQY